MIYWKYGQRLEKKNKEQVQQQQKLASYGITMTYKSESLLITQQLTIATLAYNLLTQSLTCINLANPFGVHASGLLRHFLISSESQLIDQHLTVNSLRVHEGKWGFRLILRCFF